MWVEVIYPIVVLILVIITVLLAMSIWLWCKHHFWQSIDWIGEASDKGFYWAVDKAMGSKGINNATD